MKHILLIFSVLFFINLSAQTFRGKVVNEQNEPVAAASVYVQQTRQGLITNDLGEFEIKLKPATYNAEIRCLGYETYKLKIIIQDIDIQQIIQLKNNDFRLSEVSVTAGEDPAYPIMRKAIQKSPYYRNVVKSTVYEAYTKGSGKFLEIPKMFEAMMSKEDKKEMNMMRDKLFLLESFCEVKFIAPSIYKQTIKAFSSSIPMMNDPKSAMFAGMYSLYNEYFSGAVSPLNKNAFDYYRFRYEGFDEENGETVNKIRIIPKLHDARFMEGVLYIADNEWNIRYVEIKTQVMGMTFFYKLNYHAVLDDIYLITDYEVELDANIMGAKMKANLLSSMQFTDIQLNDSLISAEKNKSGISSAQKQKKQKKSLEVKREDFFKQNVDTLANMRDSVYWNEVRKVVLTEEEQQSYARRDTLEQHIDSVSNTKRNPKFQVSDLLTGGKVGNDSSLLYFSYSGLLGALHDYNFVDGFVLGQRFSFDFKNRKGKHFVVTPALWWATARKTLIWNVDLNFDYAPKRLGNLNLNFGQASEDYAAEMGMNRLLNSAYSLLAGRNYAKLFDNKKVTLKNTIDIANGLNFGVEMQLSHRQPLTVNTTWNIFALKDKWTDNIPSIKSAYNQPVTDLAKFGVHFSYTPEYYYEMRDTIYKHYLHSRFPTFSLDFQYGNDFNTTNFQRLELSVNQSIELNIFSKLHYKLAFGKFLNNKANNFIDFQHFNTNGNLLFSFKDFNHSFVLLPFYSYSTNNQWFEAQVNYNSDYILLKRLPFLQGKFFGESLHLKFLHTTENQAYTEFGYSLGLGGVAKAGVFVSFEKAQFGGAAFQISIPIFKLFAGNNNRGNRSITIGTKGIDVEL